MFPFKRILLPTDFSLCAEAAYRHGLFLGRHFGAEVHFLHVADATTRPVDTAWPDRLTAPRSDMSAYSEHWRDLLLHRAVVASDDPVPAILDYAREEAIDLIVIGAHGERGTGHFLNQGPESVFLGRTAEQVIRHAACPVMKVVMQNGGSRPDKVKRMLVPMDTAALSSLALAYARELAALYGAHIDLLHVVVDPLADDAVLEHARKDLIEAYDQARGASVSASFHVASGLAERRIRSFIKRHDIQMVVQGAHSDLGRDLLGHVAGEIVRTVPCSVLTVRDEVGLPAYSALSHGGLQFSGVLL